MKKKDIIRHLETFRESYEMDLEDEEMMERKATFRQIAKTNVNTINTCIALLKHKEKRKK